MVEDIIQNYSTLLIKALSVVKASGAKNYLSYDFDCSFFCMYSLDNIEKSDEHMKYHKMLSPIKGPSVYFFEILSDTDSSAIRLALNNYKLTKQKAVPAIKRTFDANSKILYVGKVKRAFWSRVIQHLGYYKNHQTQGLQLYHWAKQLNLSLRLHVYEFEEEMSNLVGPFEYHLARELNPIIGKH